MADIEQAKAWCNEARVLLKRNKKKRGFFSGSKSPALKKVVPRIEKLLNEIEVAGAETIAEGYAKSFSALAKQLHEIEQATRKTDKQKVLDIEGVVGKLETLAGKMDDALKQAQAVQKDRVAYDKNIQQARIDLALFEANPNANYVNARRMLSSAEAKAENGLYPEANKVLIDLDKGIKAQKKTSDGLQKKQLTQLGKEPDYSSKLGELQELVWVISEYPGIRAELDAYKDIIARAEKLGAQDDYVAALAVFDEIKKKKLLDKKKLLKLSKERLAAHEQNNPGFEKMVAAAELALTALKPVALTDEFNAHRVQVAAYADSVIDGDGNEKITALLELPKRTAEISERAKNLAAKQKTSADNVVAMGNPMINLRGDAGPEIVSIYSQRLEWIQAAIDTKRYDESAPASTDLLKDLLAAEAEYRAAKTAWNKTKSKRADLLKACDTIYKDCPPASQRASVLKGSLGALEHIATVDPKDPQAAIRKLDALGTEIAQLEQGALADWKAIASERAAAVQARSGFEQKIEAALQGLGQAITKARSATDTVATDGSKAFIPFESDAAEILARWQSAIDTALTKEDLLTKALTAESGEFLEQVQDAGKKENIDAAVALQKNDESRRKFEAAWTDLQAALDQLAARNDVEADAIDDTAAWVKLGAEKDYEQAISDLVPLKKKAVDELAAAKNEQIAAKLAVDKSRADIEKALTILEKKVKDKLFKPFFEDLRTELQDLDTMMASTNVNALTEVGEMLLGIKRKVAQLSSDMEHSSESFKTVSAMAKELSDRLGGNAKNETTKVLTECTPKRLELLQKQLAGLNDTINSQTPDASLLALRKLKGIVDKAEVTALGARAMREVLKTEIKAVSGKVKQLDKRLEYRKDAAARLKELEGKAVTEGQETKALDGLTKLKIELNRALTDPAFLLDKDTAVNQQLQQKARDGIQWSNRLMVFQKSDYVKAEKAVAAVGGDTTLIDELDRMIKSMKGLAKSENYDDANQQLDMAKQRVRDIIKRPYGPTIGSRNELPKDLKVFQAAVKGYNQAMSAFPDAIVSLSDEKTKLDDKALGAIRRMMKTTENDFVLTAFDHHVKVLAAKETPTNTRRAAREAALAIVRQYQKKLQTSKVTQELISNPIEKQNIPSAMSGLYYALNRIQGNVLRACK